MVEILTVFKYGQGCGLGVFFDPFAKGSRGFSNVGGLTAICFAFPMIGLNLSFGHWRFCPFGCISIDFEGVSPSLETNLYWCVLKDFLVGLT